MTPSEIATEPQSSDRLQRGLAIAGLVVAAVAQVVIIWQNDYAWVNWSDRDLVRASRLFADWPTTGAEMNYGTGARIPGGAYLWMLGVPLAFGVGPDGIMQLLFSADALAMALLATLMWRRHGPVASAITALVYVSTCDARKAMGWLWNPALIPLFMALSHVLLSRAIERGRPKELGLWAFVIAAGASCHVTVGAWGLWTLLALVLFCRDVLKQGWRWLLLGAVLPYLPYMLTELIGWTHNGQLLEHQGRSSWATPSGQMLSDVTTSVSHLMVQRLVPEGDTLWVCTVAGVVAALCVLVSATVRTATARVVLVPLVITLLTPALRDGVNVEWRYFVCAISGWALLAGMGGAVVVERAGRAKDGLAAVLVLLLAIPPAGGISDRLQTPARDTVLTWNGMEALRERLLPEVDGSLAELHGRLVIVRDYEGLFEMVDHASFYALQRNGETWQGSRPGPCWMVVLASTDGPSGPERLVEMLDIQGDAITVGPPTQLASADWLYPYEIRGGRCLSSGWNRYLDTPHEASFRQEVRGLPVGEVQVVGLDDGTRFLFRDEGPASINWTLMAAVDITMVDEGVRAVLRSNQLRGFAYNAGWFGDGTLRDPRLVFTQGDRVETVHFYEGWVGRSGIVTPLDVPVALDSGTWRVSFAAETVPSETRWHPASLEGESLAVMQELGEVVIP